jgi:hypothetical protein
MGVPQWRERDVDEFLAKAEVEAILDLIEALPEEKHAPMIDQLLMSQRTPQDVEQMFGRYYTRKQMRESVINRTKKAIATHIVEPYRKKLSPQQRDTTLSLLEQLTY